MGMDESSMVYVHLAKDDLLGSYPWKGGLDLLIEKTIEEVEAVIRKREPVLA